MFSKRRQPKSDFFGIIRNIFTNGSTKSTKNRDNTFEEVQPKDKNSFKRIVKSKLSFHRMGSIKYDANEETAKYVEYLSSPAQNLKFDDVDLSLSSILKDSRSSIKSHKKKLRFDWNVTQETSVGELSILSQCDEKKYVNVPESNEDEFNDSDDDYYKKMKDDLLSRKKKAPFPKPKRNKSFKKDTNDINMTDITNCDDFVMGETQSSETGRFFNNNQIEKWQNGYTDIYNNTSYDILAPESLTTEINMNSLNRSELRSYFKNKETLHASGKITSGKISKKNRFNPLCRSNESSCGVALLKNMKKKNSNVSWCSVSSF